MKCVEQRANLMSVAQQHFKLGTQTTLLDVEL